MNLRGEGLRNNFFIALEDGLPAKDCKFGAMRTGYEAQFGAIELEYILSNIRTSLILLMLYVFNKF